MTPFKESVKGLMDWNTFAEKFKPISAGHEDDDQYGFTKYETLNDLPEGTSFTHVWAMMENSNGDVLDLVLTKGKQLGAVYYLITEMPWTDDDQDVLDHRFLEDGSELEAIHNTYYELIKNNVTVRLEWIGEGFGGDYDPYDPEDKPLIRFSVYVKDTPESLGGFQWDEVADASYCTQIQAFPPSTVCSAIMGAIMDEVYQPINDGHSVKKACERLSWMTIDDAVKDTINQSGLQIQAQCYDEDGQPKWEIGLL